jgi:phosphopentomutase
MKLTFERIVLLVLDSVGIGATPDAAAYGDAGRDNRRELRTGT